MEARRMVCVYGNSVILSALGASLRRYPQFKLTMLAPPLPQTEEMQALKPDVLIFDLEAAHTETVFSLLETCPGLLLVGVSPDTNLVKVWSGKQLRELSTRDLTAIIGGKAMDSPGG